MNMHRVTKQASELRSCVDATTFVQEEVARFHTFVGLIKQPLAILVYVSNTTFTIDLWCK